MPENFDQDLLSAIERFKKDEDTPRDRKIIVQAFASRQIEITPVKDSKVIVQEGGANFGESNEIQISGPVIGTQIISGITYQQALEIEKLRKRSRDNKTKIIVALIGAAAVIIAPIIALVLENYLSTGPFSLPTSTPTVQTNTPTMTLTATATPTNTPTPSSTLTATSSQTYTPSPTMTISPTPTNTFTPTSVALFMDMFENYEISSKKWNLTTELEGKIYRRTITKNRSDNKFVHFMDCEPEQGPSDDECIGRNEIPMDETSRDFNLDFDVEYRRIPPIQSGLYLPYICINFRRYDERNYYNLCFRIDGKYRWLRVIEGKHEACGSITNGNSNLRNEFIWKESTALKEDTEKNRIRLIADGDEYLFEANDETISKCKDDSLLSVSGIEIAINSFKNVPSISNDVELEIDNIFIYRLP